MNVAELNAKYDEIYDKNLTILKLLAEVEDYNEILHYLYDTPIRRPNITLNTMIDTYERLILQLREADQEMVASLRAFGDETELSSAVIDNDAIPEKARDLILWKLRRLFMIYDAESIRPYLEGDYLELELIGTPREATNKSSAGAQVRPEGGVFPPEMNDPVNN